MGRISRNVRVAVPRFILEVSDAAIYRSPSEAAGNGSPVYLWLYRFSHTIAGNLTTDLAAGYRA